MQIWISLISLVAERERSGGFVKQGVNSEETSQRRTDSAAVRLWTPVFVVIIALTFCCFVVGQGLNSGTSVYLTGLGYGASLSGVLAMVFSFAAAFTRLLIGPVIDSGRCSLVIKVGIVVLIVSTFMTALVDGVVLITLCRLLQGAGFAAATTAASTAAADVLPAERLGEGIGYHGLGQALATSVGPAFALFLAGTNPSSNLYVGLALVGVVGFLIALGSGYEKHPDRLPETSGYRVRWEKSQLAREERGTRETQGTHETKAEKQSLRQRFDVFEPRALPGAIPMCILCPTFGFGIFFVGLYGTTLGYANAGLFYTISAVVMILVRMLSKRFMDTVPAIKTLTVAIAAALVGFALLFFAGQGELVFLASGLPYGLALGLSLPLNQSVAVKNTPSERWGAANALFLLFNDLGIGISCAIWGPINDVFGFQVSILLVMVCQILSYIVAWVVYPANQKRWRA